MHVYLNAAVMLVATIAAFVALAKLAQLLWSGRLHWLWKRGRASAAATAPSLLRVEHACAIDSKRRMIAVRCGNARILLLTGGPADLVVSVAEVQGGQA